MESQIIGMSLIIREKMKLLEKAARSDVNVLIVGETGTGKDLFARRVHELSIRRRSPFLAVNCANIPESLFESEFFGFAKGSFTGAFREKQGLLESVMGGTLFLDEIGELPLHLQAKMLRFIDKRESRRVGDTVNRKLDVRFLFATNRPLSREVSAGTFRQDLYYRISVVKVWIPPLRDRQEDIPLLAEYFLNIISKRTGQRKVFSDEALTKLNGYQFPGNVRELENIIERASVLSEGSIIHAEDIRIDRAGELDRPTGLSKEQIKKILITCRWNKTQAANKIGKSRRQLYRLLEKLQMDDCIKRVISF